MDGKAKKFNPLKSSSSLSETYSKSSLLNDRLLVAIKDVDESNSVCVTGYTYTGSIEGSCKRLPSVVAFEVLCLQGSVVEGSLAALAEGKVGLIISLEEVLGLQKTQWNGSSSF